MAITQPAQSDRSAIRVRPYREEDRDQVRRVFAETVVTVEVTEAARKHWPGYVRESLETDLDDIAGWYQELGGNFWVATVSHEDPAIGEKVVGITGLKLMTSDPKHGEVRRVFIDAKYHRLGIGRKLMDETEAWAKLHGYKSVELSTNAKNVRSNTFYQTLGYTRLPDNGDTLWNDPECFPIAYYSKEL